MHSPLNEKFLNRNYFLFSIVFIVFSFFILQSFLFGMLWGVVIAISVWPICEYISVRCCRHKNWSFLKVGTQQNAFLFTILFSILFLVPIWYAFTQFSSIYLLVTSYIETNSNLGVLQHPSWFIKLPLHERIIGLWQEYIATSQGILKILDNINTEKVLIVFSTVWTQVLNRIITIIVMIVTLFYMLKNGNLVKQHYQQVLNYWFSSKSTISVVHGIESLKGTINGVILVGIVEGILLSIPLIAGGINSGLIIGLIAGIAGVIPLLMPVLILPCLAYLFFNNEVVWSIIGCIDLLIIWFIFENIIKPKIISKSVKINTFIILISMIGGMQILGPVGLFLGPAVVSMAIGMIKDYIKIPFDNHLN